jgi:hypothetical protein
MGGGAINTIDGVGRSEEEVGERRGHGGRGRGTGGGFRRSGDEEALGWFGRGRGRLSQCGILAEVTRVEEEEEGAMGGPCV